MTDTSEQFSPYDPATVLARLAKVRNTTEEQVLVSMQRFGAPGSAGWMAAAEKALSPFGLWGPLAE